MPGQFFDSFLMKIPLEKMGEIRGSMKRLAKAMFQMGNTLRDNYSEQALTDSLLAVDEASKKLEEIAKKLKSEES